MHQRRWIRRTLIGVAIMAIAALYGAGLVVDYLSTRGFSLVEADETLVPSATPLVGAGADRSPILDFLGDEVRSPVRPNKTVALTFDDGPDPRWTPQVLEVLRKHNAKATFFMVGSRALDHPDLVRQVRSEGHDLGNHTFSHSIMGAQSEWRQRVELSLTNIALARSGRTSRIYRPPYSGQPKDLSATEYRSIRDAGYLVVLTDLVARDWETVDVDTLVAQTTPRSDDGAIITFHDAGGSRAHSVAALDQLLTNLDVRGFRYVTISEYAGLNPGDVMEAPSISQRISAFTLAVVGTNIDWVDGLVRWGSLVLILLGVARAIMVLVLARSSVHRERRRPKPEFDLPPVSILVPAYNEELGIEAAIRSLAASDYPEFEILVIDDGSTDRTAEIARSTGLANVRVISQANAGKAAALNNGARHASHGIVVLIDGDTVFEPTTLRHLVEPFADEGVGAVGGTVKVGNRQGLLGRWQHIEYVVSCVAERRMFDRMGCVPCVPGAVGAYRRSVLAEVGGVPTNTLAEDTDLTIAVQRAGWRVAFAPQARAWTEVPLTFKSLWRQRYRWNYGTLQAIWKNRRAVRETGPGGRLGRFAFPYVITFSLLFALMGPLVDVFAVLAIFGGQWQSMLYVWGVINLLALLVAAYAFHLDGESMKPLWALPLQQFVHRQMMYLVVLASLRSAVMGTRLRWHKLARTGLDTSRLPDSVSTTSTSTSSTSSTLSPVSAATTTKAFS